MFENINKLFKITPNPYWENHYNFNENETTHSVSLGRQTINSIIINSIIPALYAYGEHYNMVRYKDLAFLLLPFFPPQSTCCRSVGIRFFSCLSWNFCLISVGCSF